MENSAHAHLEEFFQVVVIGLTRALYSHGCADLLASPQEQESRERGSSRVDVHSVVRLLSFLSPRCIC